LDSRKQKLDTATTHFGLRLRALLEKRDNPYEDFIQAMGISRATMFNWFKREKQPPSLAHRQRLVQFFANQPPEYVLTGRVKNESNIGQVAEEQAQYGLFESLDEELRFRFNELILAAKNDPSRLGWIREQMSAHLQAPAHWRNNDELNRRAVELAAQLARETAERERAKHPPSPSQDNQQSA
jgi:transcriptional regulator with XRE-family HTH domain